MGITLRMAWRNLWRHSRRTWLTVSAIAFSAALLVFMIALQLGSYAMIINVTLRVFPGDIQVQHAGYNSRPKIRSTVPAADALAERIRQDTIAHSVAVRGYGFALASSRDRSYGVQVVGVQPQYEGGVSTIPGLVRNGRYLASSGKDEAVIGALLARNLRIKVGDELTLLGSAKDGSMAATVLPVVGIFQSGSPDIDRNMVEIPLATFRNVFSMGTDAHAIVIDASDIGQLPKLLNEVRSLLPQRANLVALPWQELVPGLEQLIRMDMASAWFTYLSLIIVVTFSILNTFLMAVLERTREFGLMLALGSSPLTIGRLILLESLLLTLIGLAVGVVLGAGVSWYFYVRGLTFPGMKELYAQYGLPGVLYPQISLLALFLGPAAILVFTSMAALYPALRIRRLRPVDAMQAI